MMHEISLNIFKNSELIPILLVSLVVCGMIFLGFKLLKKSIHCDFFYILLIMSVYAVVSLWQLGSFTTPLTWWQPQEENEFITFEVLDEIPSFDTVYAIGGEGDNNALESGYQVWFNDLEVLGSNDNENWDYITVLNNKNSYMAWNITKGDWNYKYISLITKDKQSVIHEIAFRKTGTTDFLSLKPIYMSNNTNPYPATNIVDEQSVIPLQPTYFDSSYFDEIYHPRNAWEIANGQDMYATVHPLLGTSIIAVGINLFGMNPFGWRIMGALFGILILPLLYLTLKKLFKNRFLSTIGTVLFASDFMLITTSRIGTLEPFSVFFILLMTYFMIQYFYTSYTTTPFKRQLLWLSLAGISMGLACSVKWTGCYSAIGLAIIFFTHFVRNFITYRKCIKCFDDDSILFANAFKRRSLKTILWCCLFFVVVPATIYAVSFIPCHVWKNDTWSIPNVIKHSVGMYNYHATLEATHPYQSVWYQWLLNIRPIWYYFTDLGHGLVKTISCFNNPMISFLGLGSLLFTIFHTYKTKSKEGFVILVGYFSALLPWVMVTRCIFSYHYYPSLPFLVMSIVYAAKHVLVSIKNGNKLVLALTILSVILFLVFLPATTGFTSTANYIKLLQWLPSWSFGGYS